MPCGISEAVAAALITAAAGAATTGATLATKGSDKDPRFVPTEESQPTDFETQLSQNRINIQKQPNLSLRNFNQPRRLTRF